MPAPSVAPVPVVLATSNGVGMGHLTRQLTVAISAPEDMDPILFSLSGALPTVHSAVLDGRLPELRGVRSEYCPSRRHGWLPKGALARRLREVYPAYGWEAYFAERLCALVAETGARLVLFDGVVPYAGLRSARRHLPNTPFVWMRRGMWRDGVGEQWLAHSGDFDLVIEPGDFAAAGDLGATADRTDAVRVPPLSIADVIECQDRPAAREALGLEPDRPAILLHPGTGALEDVASPARVALAHLREHAPEWQVAVTNPALARHQLGEGDDALVLLRDTYPLARSMAAFDLAVSAAGYNSVHELLGAGVPTLLVPGQRLGTDDQEARAATLTRQGVCRSVAADDPEGMRRELDRLLDEGERARLTEACARLPTPSGARAVADHVMNLARDAPEPRGLAESGPWGPPRWRRSLPDPRTRVAPPGPDGTPGQPTRTRRRLRVTETLPPGRLGPAPLEHLLPGSSPAYREVRSRIAAWIYRS